MFLLYVSVGLCVYYWFIECWYRVSCFFFKQKTAYEMRISDWSSDVCSSDLLPARRRRLDRARHLPERRGDPADAARGGVAGADPAGRGFRGAGRLGDRQGVV